MAKQLEQRMSNRIIGLILICIILFFLSIMRLFGYQIVDGSMYLGLAERTGYTTVKIPSARGEIFDRNGVPFTENTITFNVELDYAFLTRGTENTIIYSLIKTFEAMDQTWIDTMPITKTRPYEFLEGRDNDINRLKSNLKLQSYASAEDCMNALYELDDAKYAKTEFADINGVDYMNYTEEYKRKIAGVRYEMISKSFSAYNLRYTFAEDITPQLVAFIKELSNDFIGVEIVERATRTYIGGEVASHLIGKIGLMNETQIEYYLALEDGDYAMNDLVGQGGVEEAFEEILRGKNGEMQVVRNSSGTVVDVIESITPKAGKSVALTIDYDLNKNIDGILEDYIINFNQTNRYDKVSKAAAIVVLDVNSGGLLSNTSYPYFDQSDYYTNYSYVLSLEGNPMFNRALNGLYRPGSTFKTATSVAGLATGVITTTSTHFCEIAYRYWPDWQPPPSCLGDNHGYTHVDLVSALKWSCNNYYYDAGRIMGIDAIVEYANLLGLGTDTGIEVSSSHGAIASPEYSARLGVRWEEGDVIQTAIGQLDTVVTPLQMAVQAMTIANRGTRYEAHLLEKVTDFDGENVYEKEQATVLSEIDLTDEDWDTIIEGMIAASTTLYGAYNLTDLGYDVAIKTGTPEVSNTRTNSTFIAFAPADDPQIAIACVIEDGYNSRTLLRDLLKACEQAGYLTGDGVISSASQIEYREQLENFTKQNPHLFSSNGNLVTGLDEYISLDQLVELEDVTMLEEFIDLDTLEELILAQIKLDELELELELELEALQLDQELLEDEELELEGTEETA